MNGESHFINLYLFPRGKTGRGVLIDPQFSNVEHIPRCKSTDAFVPPVWRAAFSGAGILPISKAARTEHDVPNDSSSNAIRTHSARQVGRHTACYRTLKTNKAGSFTH